MALYNVAIVTKPKKDEEEQLVYGPVALVAADEQSAQVAAVIQAGETLNGFKPAQLKVLVRPF